jgi:hypothetical protein
LKVHPSLALILDPFRLSSVRLIIFLVCLQSNDYAVVDIFISRWKVVYHRGFLLSNILNTLNARIIPAFRYLVTLYVTFLGRSKPTLLVRCKAEITFMCNSELARQFVQAWKPVNLQYICKICRSERLPYG